MAISLRFIAFSDAYYMLNQVKGLPDTISGLEHRNRCITTCILLSWVGVEAAVADELRRLRKQGYSGTLPTHLRGGVEFLLNRKNAQLDLENFKKLKKLRNDLTHPTAVLLQPPTEASADASFNYCIDLVKAFYSFGLHL